jgi:hypothetical protein
MCDAVVGLSELTKQILLVLAQALDEQEKRRLADIKEQKGLADLEVCGISNCWTIILICG